MANHRAKHVIKRPEGKRNFKNPAEIERYLFDVLMQAKEGKLPSTVVTACSAAARVWLNAHEQRREEDILRRLDGLEALLLAKDKKAKQ